MGYVAKLTKGGRTLDLASGRYALGKDFVPPRTNIIPYMATGTSANRYGGASKIGEVAVNGSLSFSVRVMGSSSGEVDRGVKDIAWFLRQAGDESDPVYFEWRSDSNVSFEPLWGQFGANPRVEIVSGTVDRWWLYGQGNLKDKAVFAIVAMEIKPFVMGKRQRLAQAKGLILEDDLGTVDGRSRGIKIPIAKTNLFNNPILGHATYDNDWTAGANVVATENINPDYILFHASSVKLQAVDTTANTFTESLPTVIDSTYCVSCYIKLPDGGTPSDSMCKIYGAGAAQTTTFLEKGNGWWRCHAVYVALANPSACGLQVFSGYTIYADGFQAENTGYPTPLICGDFLGCSWAGTAHDSDSTSTDSWVRIAASEALSVAEGTVRVVWYPDVTSGHGSDLTLFDHSSSGELWGYYDVSEGKFVFRVNGTNATSSAQTFTRSSIVVLHFVYYPATLKIYRDGVEIATANWGGPPTVAAGTLYIGNQSDLSTPAWGTFGGFATYDQAMSAAEVAADYANVYSIVEHKEQLEPIPYLWTKDGDDVVDNCNDDTRDNWCTVGGVAGDTNAETEYRIAMSNIAARQTIIGIMTHNYGEFVNPSGYLYGEQSGSADANSSGGEYYTKSSVGTSATLIGPSSTAMSQRGVEALLGTDIYYVARLYDASASTLQLAIYYPIPSGSVGTYRNVTMPETTWGLHYTNSVALPTRNELIQTLDYGNRTINNKSFGLYGRHVTGTSDVRIDFFAIVPRPMAILGDGDAVTGSGFVLNGRKITEVASDMLTVYEKSYISGDVIDLFPNKLNVLISHLGYASDADITRTLTYTIYITPRWSIG